MRRPPGKLHASLRVLLVVLCLAATWLAVRFTLPSPIVPSLHSTAAFDRNGDLLGASAGGDGQWRFPRGDSVPERFRKAILAAEDRRFRWHPGVDPVAVVRALRHNLSSPAGRQGASTITMQLARLSRKARGATTERGWRAKLLETWLALRMELALSKDEILALYCAHAPFGGNVVGLEAASWRWYGKSPAELSWGEAAALAAIPKAPHRLRPQGDKDALRERRAWILSTLARQGEMDSMGRSLADAEPLPLAPKALPRETPHLLELLKSQGPGRRWATGIDLNLQRSLSLLAREHRQELLSQGIKGLGVIVCELPEDGSAPVVRAWIGGIQDGEDGSHVDLALAPRSTGSTLKPFLYGQLLDQGRILPKQWLLDVPSRYGDFRPQNASGVWEGLVPANAALARSLNVPWVRQLRELGVEPFHAFLRDAGLWHLFRPAGDYGLALALGAGEASLAELVALYAALGSNGISRPLDIGRSREGEPSRIAGPPAGGGATGSLKAAHKAFLATSPDEQARRILSPGANWLVLEALRLPGRSEEEAAWKAWAGSRPVAWKTGTSFGHRDAWAIGVTPRWVVGVWAGNPMGDGRPHLWGSSAAAPLLFRTLPLLALDNRSWFQAPTDLVGIEVCPDTRWKRSSLCPSGTVDLAPAAARSAPPDPYHRVFHLDSAGFQVDAGCEPTFSHELDTLLVPPPGAASYMESVHPGLLPRLPSPRSDCKDLPKVANMEILLPENGSTLTLPIDLTGTPQNMVAEVRHRLPSAVIRCFLDQRDLGRNDRFRSWSFRPEVGPHTLTCSDDLGETVRSEFRVEHSGKLISRSSLPAPPKMGTMGSL